MDLDSSPNKSLEDAKDDGFGFGFVGKRSAELDLNLAASKDEEGDEEYAHDENVLGDHEHRGMCAMDLNLQEHRKPPESCVEIGVGFRTRSSKSPPPNPRSASPVPIDNKFFHTEIGSDHYLGKSPTPVTESRISDYRLGSSDYNSDRLQSPEDSKSHEGDDTRKTNSDQQPMSAVNPDDYPKETERENTDLCEQKSILQVTHEHFNDETGPENPDQLSEKMAFEPRIESAEEEMEITHDHHLRGLLSPAVTVDSDDEAKNEHFYSGKSGYPVSREPYNYNGEVEGENSYLQSPGRTPKRLASPVRRQMSVSPERSPYDSRSSGQKPPSLVKDFQEPGSYETQALQPPVSDTSRSPRAKNRSPSPGLSRQKLSPSPKRDLPKDYVLLHASPYSKRQLSPFVRQSSHSPAVRQSSRSPAVRRSSRSPAVRRSSRSPAVRRSSRSPAVRRSSRSPAVRRSSRSPERAPAHDTTRQRDGSPRNHLSPSPRRRYSPPRGHGRHGRSASRSPVRRRDAYSGSRRDYRERSRSRSPYSRDQFRRSPRRRYSPRRRSPPRYHSRYRSPRRRPWSPPPNRSTGVGKPGNNLFIAGFSFVTTERDLERKFSRFGRVTDVRVVRDKRSGDSRGFGFLSLERDEDADAAIRALDQTEWNGRVVLVEKSKTPAR